MPKQFVNAGEKFLVRLKNFRAHDGTATTIDGEPQWSANDPDAVKLTPVEDGMACVHEFLAAKETLLTKAVYDPKPGPAVGSQSKVIEWGVAGKPVVECDVEIEPYQD